MNISPLVIGSQNLKYEDITNPIKQLSNVISASPRDVTQYALKIKQFISVESDKNSVSQPLKKRKKNSATLLVQYYYFSYF